MEGNQEMPSNKDIDELSPKMHGLAPSGSESRLVAERKLVRKLDVRLLPTIFLIYIMNYIDRTGVTTARLKGMQEDLHISDVQYATVIAILFVSYCPAQIPSNMILNKAQRPSLYIGLCAVLWGLTSALTGITHNLSGILACRVFIGLPEAAFYPGAMYLLSKWYTRKELAFRAAFLYSGFLISNAFGTLMAAGILARLEGVRGLRAWRWLFFIEGGITILVGFLSMWLLPDYPHNTRWISGSERHLAQVRLAEDAGEADEDDVDDSPVAGLKLALKDPKVWLFALMAITELLGLSFVQYFPTLTQTLGYNTTITLLVAAPPWLLAAVVCCLNALHADRTGERFFHTVGWWWLSMIGFIIALSTMSVAGRYFSLFLLACGYPGSPMRLVWLSNTIARPPAKRAAAIAIVNGFGNIAGAIGSYTWKASWGPKYHQSMIICISFLIVSSLVGLVVRQLLISENGVMDDEVKGMAKVDVARVKEAARLEGLTFEQALENRKKYRYLY